MARFIGVTLTQEIVHVIPGESAAIGITVQNDSNVVDVLYIEVEGLDPAWYQLSVVRSALFPGDQASGTLTITPPKTSDSTAKNYSFTVKATSQKDPSQATSLTVDLEVQPFHSFEMRLQPQKVTGVRGAYKLRIKNTGNADLNIDLEGQEPEDLCRFTFDHQRPRVSPGQDFEVAVQVEPGKRPFRGRPRGYRMTLTGTPDPGTAEPVSVPAELDAIARLPGILNRAFAPFRWLPRIPNLMAPLYRLPRWAKVAAGIAVSVVILVVVLVFAGVFSDEGGWETDFLINPDKTKTYGFELSDSDVTRIHAEAEWEKPRSALVVVVQRPDGTFSDELPITRSGGRVTFLVDAASARQGKSGWAMGVTNTSASEQAEGTLKITFSK